MPCREISLLLRSLSSVLLLLFLPSNPEFKDTIPCSSLPHRTTSRLCPWSAWCCADRSGCTLMVPYNVTRRVSSAYHSAVAGASQSTRGVQSTLRVLPPHSE